MRNYSLRKREGNTRWTLQTVLHISVFLHLFPLIAVFCCVIQQVTILIIPWKQRDEQLVHFCSLWCTSVHRGCVLWWDSRMVCCGTGNAEGQFWTKYAFCQTISVLSRTATSTAATGSKPGAEGQERSVTGYRSSVGIPGAAGSKLVLFCQYSLLFSFYAAARAGHMLYLLHFIPY